MPPSVDRERALLDALLLRSRLYRTGADYKALLDFVVRLRPFAPFNAMLLQIQKPGARYVASSYDWRARFGRSVRPGARPLLILWPFGPVALVYDLDDTDGPDLPEGVGAFPAKGPMTAARLMKFRAKLDARHIIWFEADHGAASAGAIHLRHPDFDGQGSHLYHLLINRHHAPAQQFVTLAHELAHLFLGHLGEDRKRGVPARAGLSHARAEREAESVAYLVCERNGVESKSEAYLSAVLGPDDSDVDVDIYQVVRAAGQVEHALGLVPAMTVRMG